MAEKIRLFEVEFDFDAAIADMAALKNEIDGLRDTNKDLKKTAGEVTPEFERNAQRIRDLSKEYRIQQKLVDDLNRNRQQEIKIIGQTDGSIKSLEAALRRNKDTYRQLTEEQRKNDSNANKLLETIKKQDAEYKRLQTSIGTTQVNVGDYAGAMRQVIAENKNFGGVLGGILGPLKAYQAQVTAVRNAYVATTQATAGSTGALRAFTAALVATGIGAFLVAIGSLVALLTQTQRGLDFVAVTGAQLGSIFGNLTDISIRMGDAIVRAVRNPVDSIKGLGRAVTDNIVNRFRAVIDVVGGVGDVMGKLVRGEFKEAKKEAGNLRTAFVQLATGLDAEQQEKFGEAIGGTAKEMANEFKIAGDLKTELIDLKKQEADLNVVRAQSRARIRELNLVAQDVSKSDEERANAAREALKIEHGILKQQEVIQSRRVELLRQQNDLSESTEADLQRVRDAEIELARTREESISFQTRINSRLSTLTQKSATEQKKATDDQIKEEERKQAALQKTAEEQEAFAQKVLQSSLEGVAAVEAAYEEELKKLGAFGVDREALTASQLEALKVLEAKYEQERQAAIDKAATDRLNSRLASAAREFEAEQAARNIQLNLELLQLGNDEEAKAEVRKRYREADLAAAKALAEQQIQEIQAILTQDLTASTDLGISAKILSEEEKEALNLRLLEVREQLSELDLQVSELGFDEEGERRSLSGLLGITEEGIEGVQSLLQGASEAISAFGQIATQRQTIALKALDDQLKKGLISQEKYDKQKEQLERQAFERQKKIQAATATVSYLQGIVNVLSAPSTIPDPFGAIYKGVQVGILSATYAAQLAGIKKATFEEGGLVQGPSHDAGGIPFRVRGSSAPMEMEGGEYIVNKKAAKQYRSVLDQINYALAPRFGRGPGMYQDGGIVPVMAGVNQSAAPIDVDLLAERIAAANANIQIVTSVRDIIDETARVNEVEQLATI